MGQKAATQEGAEMKLKKLKELLASGAITQEEYDELAKTAKPDDDPADPPFALMIPHIRLSAVIQ